MNEEEGRDETSSDPAIAALKLKAVGFSYTLLVVTLRSCPNDDHYWTGTCGSSVAVTHSMRKE